jgi:hypothetical protein
MVVFEALHDIRGLDAGATLAIVGESLCRPPEVVRHLPQTSISQPNAAPNKDGKHNGKRVLNHPVPTRTLLGTAPPRQPVRTIAPRIDVRGIQYRAVHPGRATPMATIVDSGQPICRVPSTMKDGLNARSSISVNPAVCETPSPEDIGRADKRPAQYRKTRRFAAADAHAGRIHRDWFRIR